MGGMLLFLGLILSLFMAWRLGIRHGAGIAYDQFVFPLRAALSQISDLAKLKNPGTTSESLGAIADRALNEQQRDLDKFNSGRV